MHNLISRRKFFQHTFGGVLGAGLSAISSAMYITQIEPTAVETTHITIPMRNLPASFDDFTLVQISDWHLGEWMTLDRMLSIAGMVNEMKPDVTVLTGDFMSRVRPNTFREVTEATQAFNAPDGVFATLGNHDYWMNPKMVRNAVEAAGNCQLLLNANVPIQRGTDMLYIAGVDDLWEKKNDLNKALTGIPDHSPAILLAHEPDGADAAAATGKVGLQLSGHTHGGQVRAPIKGAIILPRLGRKYPMGLYNVQGMSLYVNRGLGMVAPYVRFNCRPEITRITLKAA